MAERLHRQRFGWARHYLAASCLAAACGASETREPVRSPGGGTGGQNAPVSGAAGRASGGREPASGGDGGEETGGNAAASSGIGGSDDGASGAAGSPSNGMPVVWSGSIGTLCAAGDREVVVLLAGPARSSCAARVEDLSGDGESFVRAELPVLALDGPIELSDVPARFCDAGVCGDAALHLDLEPDSDGSGMMSGTFELAPEGGAAPVHGTLTTAACTWDDYVPAPVLEPGVRDLELRAFAAFQSVKVPLMERGIALAPNRAGIIADRAALFRTYVVPGNGWVPRTVRAKLTLENGDVLTTFEKVQRVEGASSDDRLSSTLNFEVSADLLRADTRYTLELFEAKACTASGERLPGRFPETGSAALQAQLVGGLAVEIVPIRVERTSGDLLPDTSEGQIARMRAALLGLFPISDVAIHVRETPLASSAGSVLELIDELSALRDQENPGRRVSYYGLFRFTETLDEYCTASCVLGAGINGDPAAPQAGTAVGVGYTGEAAARAFAHELGHVYGRDHSPCGVAGDASYPYSGGRTGVWGYDVEQKLLVPPDHVDFMGYCQPLWVSDYVFGHLATFIAGVNADVALFTNQAPRRFRTIVVEPGKPPRFGRVREVSVVPSGKPERALAYAAFGAPAEVVVYRSSVGDSEAELVYVPDPAEHGWLGIRLPGGEFVSYASLPLVPQ